MSRREEKAVSVLSMLRLSIGNVDRDPPTDEELQMVESILTIERDLSKSMADHSPSMIVAAVAATQFLEEVLCGYKDDMPSILVAAVCKLTHHGSRHIAMQTEKSNEPMDPGETVH